MSIVAKWLNGSKMPLGTELGLGPCQIVLDGDPAPPKRGKAAQFWPMPIVAKQSPISATAEHLYKMPWKHERENSAAQLEIVYLSETCET